MAVENEGTVETPGVSENNNNGTQATTTVSNNNKAAADNTEKRIADLMSKADKLFNERERLTKELEAERLAKQEAITNGQLERLKLEEFQKAEREKTHEVLANTVQTATQYEQLYKQTAQELEASKRATLKLQVLTKEPWLNAYESLLPSTTDGAEMERVVEALRKANDSQANNIRQQLGAYTPGVSIETKAPTDVDLSDPGKLDTFLKEGMRKGNQEYQSRMERVRQYYAPKR